MQYKNLKKVDREIYGLIREEEKRQKEGLELIPSESYASSAVLEPMASILNDKYAENYPGKRYYGGCEVVDKVERLCQKRALDVSHARGYNVNVQPYSGSPANTEVYKGLLSLGDTVMALRLDHGGHLTHGSPVSISGKEYNFVHYGLDPKTERLDYAEIDRLAKKHRPKILLCGYTAYPRLIDFKKIHSIAKSVGAISMADISHIFGLVIGGVHPSPFPFMDVVTTTTHKTLRGARGAMIFSKPEFSDAIDRAVFPGMQGGPHMHTIAAIAVALKEAKKPEFRRFASQTVKNAKVLAESLKACGSRLVSGGTDNHLMLIDLRPFGPGRGKFIEKALEAAHISVNKSPVPDDSSPPFYPSGIRLGTPAVTSRGMKEKEMRVIGGFIGRVIREFSHVALPEEKSARADAVRKFTAGLGKNKFILGLKEEVRRFASRFPVPGI